MATIVSKLKYKLQLVFVLQQLVFCYRSVHFLNRAKINRVISNNNFMRGPRIRPTLSHKICRSPKKFKSNDTSFQKIDTHV